LRKADLKIGYAKTIPDRIDEQTEYEAVRVGKDRRYEKDGDSEPSS
jgi:hypothetical protein